MWVPAVDEVWGRVVNAERGSVQVSADLHVVASHETNGGLVLLVKDLPLEGRTQQQHEVVWGRGETRTSDTDGALRETHCSESGHENKISNRFMSTYRQGTLGWAWCRSQEYRAT